MQQALAVKQETVTLENLDRNIREFFTKSTILNQDVYLLPKEEFCCEQATD